MASEQNSPDDKKPFNPADNSPWKSGQSGNPKGRPKNRKTLSTLVDKVLRGERVSIQISGSTKSTVTMRKMDAVARKIVEKMLEGDIRFIQLYMDRKDPALKVIDGMGDDGRPRWIGMPAGGPMGGEAEVRGEGVAAGVGASGGDLPPSPPAKPPNAPPAAGAGPAAG